MRLVFVLLLIVGIIIAVICLLGIVIKVLSRLYKYQEKFKMKNVLIALIIGLVMASTGVYYSFYDMQHLPEGDLIKEVQSPNGDYTFNAYLVNGGATVAFCIKGEVVFNNKDKDTKIIYWSYREDTADIKWIDKETVNINGHILNVEKDKYDWRRE